MLFVINAGFCNKCSCNNCHICNKPVAFCNKIAVAFIITSGAFCNTCHSKPSMKQEPLLTPKIRFPCVWYHVHFMPNVHWSFVKNVTAMLLQNATKVYCKMR